ncbi:hypothetical protein PROFUN_11740 [Planoprotostelium fungivorum]|uniref:RNA helicase n=1 Tax=Planoprotostelium fungivorum TaxID=1890364 RepID=A0A2P6MYE7_9EUKA|nr:hypothetical protein PROFUN_11740 [Planoprotostelium fungivorum]
MSEAQRIFKSLGLGTRMRKPDFLKNKKPVAETSANTPAQLDFFKIEDNKAERKRKVQQSSDESKKKKLKKEEETKETKENDEEEEKKVILPIALIHLTNTQNEPSEEEENEEEEEDENALSTDDINLIRQENLINVSGEDVPPPITEFSQLSEYNVKQTLINAVGKCGYTQPTPIQMQATTAMLKGREVIGIAPTGSGKTMAFGISLLSNLRQPKKNGFRAVIISPTRELATQIHREINGLAEKTNQKGWKVCLLAKAAQFVPEMARSFNTKYDILVTTPLRLVHMVSTGDLQLSSVEWIIFDEADQLFDASFVKQVDDILGACTSGSLKVCLFSATLSNEVEHIARTVQKNPVKINIGAVNTATSQVDQSLLFVGREEGKILAIRNMIQEGQFKPPVLIFLQSKARALELFHELIYDGINVDIISAERTQQQRDTTVAKFRSGDIWVLITTELMARGMDFKGVELVINFDLPQSITSYIHRVGRTGRAGRRGKAVTFYTETDIAVLKPIAEMMRQSGCKDIPSWLLEKSGKKKKDTEIAPKRKEDCLE